MQLDPAPIPYEDALVLNKHHVPLAEVLIRRVGGKVVVTCSRMFWPSAGSKDGWYVLIAHGCDWNKWGKP